ncbi:MAG: hypothetical protein H7Y03_14645 [Chitinophagaceae bacterium]|nr:hypothetical protein [Chitinophagaceae bacterium]
MWTMIIAYDFKSTQQAFGIRELERTLLELSGQPAKIDISEARGTEAITVRVAASVEIKKEGFRILKAGSGYVVEAVDEAGAMYGILELAERIRLYGLEQVQSVQAEPRFPFRAIKHNTPWSSYRKDYAQDQHYDTMLDPAYWESFLNMMAENRYNTLTIWTQHPFPYMIRPKNFPKATPFTDEELAGWQHLYRSIFRMARERGIEVLLVNWNIFVSGAFREHYDPNAHIDEMGYFGEAYTTPQIEQYTRECVTQVLNEYPDLTGFGFTLGEFMGGMTPEQRQEWALKTIIEGMKAADRPVKLIYRMPLSANMGSGGSTSTDVEIMTRKTMESLTGFITPIETETKFNWSHGYASTKLIQVHGGGISTSFWEPFPTDYRINWMIRNEDFYTLRWGQTDFVREHIRLNGHSYVGGYYIGSECYYPALNYLDMGTSQDGKAQFAFERQWLLYMSWGRLLYDENTPDGVFELAFDRRYAQGTGSSLLKAYKLASSYVQLFGSYIYSTWDFTTYAEGFLCPVMAGGYDDGKSPFLSLEELMDHKVLNLGYLSIKEYVDYTVSGQAIPTWKTTPLQLADTLEQNALQALESVQNLPHSIPGIKDEVGDIQAWSYLSRYFADKLRAGVALRNYSMTGNTEQKNRAVSHIKAAKEDWLSLVSITKPRYKPTRLIHISGEFSWENFLEEVERDVLVVQDFLRS